MIGDSSLFIAHLRGRRGASVFLEQHPNVVIPFVVAAELLTGVHRSAQPHRESERVAVVLEAFPIIWPDRATLDVFATINAALRGAEHLLASTIPGSRLSPCSLVCLLQRRMLISIVSKGWRR